MRCRQSPTKLEYANDAHVKTQCLASQRVIEIEKRIISVDFKQHPGKAATARRSEFNDIPRLVFLAKLGIFSERGAGNPLQQFRIAFAKCFGRRQRKAALGAIGQANQALLKKWGKLARAELQGGWIAIEGCNDVVAILRRESVMQRQIGSWAHDRLC